MARARLGQIERDQQALALTDAAALEQQGRAYEAEGVIRFKTDSSTRVVLQVQNPQSGAWVSRDLFVVHEPEGWALVPGADLATMPEDWWAMGGDIDLPTRPAPGDRPFARGDARARSDSETLTRRGSGRLRRNPERDPRPRGRTC